MFHPHGERCVTRVGSTERREIFWRAWLARLTALAFVVQSVGLFLAPAQPAMAASQGHVHAYSDAHVAVMAMASDCPHHLPQKGGHGSSDSCPMCQSLGFALSGAILPDFTFRRDERLIGLLAIPPRHAAPDSPDLLPPPARGPPSLV
jgi:hypothetical protein